jgi:hypothetical protein
LEKAVRNNFYVGTRTDAGATVTKNGRPLDPARSLKVRRHSPTGFEWGYEGSGPAQLALALLLEEIATWRAQKLYQQFKSEVVSGLAHEGWELTGEAIRRWVLTQAPPIKETNP